MQLRSKQSSEASGRVRERVQQKNEGVGGLCSGVLEDSAQQRRLPGEEARETRHSALKVTFPEHIATEKKFSLTSLWKMNK